MLRGNTRVRLQLQQWLDAGLFGLGFWLAHFVRANWHFSFRADKLPDPISSFSDYSWLLLAVIPFSIIILEGHDFYRQPIFAPRREKAWQLARSCIICAIVLVLLMYLRRPVLARGVTVLFSIFSFLLVWTKEELLRWSRQRQLGQEHYSKRVVLVGGRSETASLRADMRTSHPELQVAGEFDLNETSIDQLIEFLHEHSINGVILSARNTLFGKIEQAIQACELEGIEAWLVADFFQTRISQTATDDFCGRPMLVFQSGPQMGTWPALVKQSIDFFGSIALLLACSLGMLLVGIVIKLTSPGPILFRQKRAGLNGKPFMMFKFRTMVTNAEQLQHELMSLNEMSGPVFKVANDPRITPVGRWLRKYSVDELPQLFNVLFGDMSLVGPRPLPVDEVRRFDDMAHRRRLSVKPGLTCLWQVGGRNEVRDFKEWVRLDLEYIDRWSLWLDLKILWLTIPVVLLGKGAR
jgi:exopolysaccharide biosynthesis polyprenyl glycosylphosphotransferase